MLDEAVRGPRRSALYNPLLQVVEATGRSRGSSATPVLRTVGSSTLSKITFGSMGGTDNYGAGAYDSTTLARSSYSGQTSYRQPHGNQPGQSLSYKQENVAAFSSALVSLSSFFKTQSAYIQPRTRILYSLKTNFELSLKRSVNSPASLLIWRCP
jgi:hypothetical protein